MGFIAAYSEQGTTNKLNLAQQVTSQVRSPKYAQFNTMRSGLRLVFIRMHLENQFVWVNTIRQAEGGAQVALHLGDFLDEWQQLSIHSFLVLLPLLCQLVLLYNMTDNTSAPESQHHVSYSTPKYTSQFTSFSVSKISPSW